MRPAPSNPLPSRLQTSWPDISATRENSLRHCTSVSFMKSWGIQFIYLGNSPRFFSVPFWDIFHCTASWGTWLMPRTIRPSWVSQLFLLACTPDGLLRIPSLLSQGSSFLTGSLTPLFILASGMCFPPCLLPITHPRSGPRSVLGASPAPSCQKPGSLPTPSTYHGLA